MNLKNALLAPDNHVEQHQLFGVSVYLRRLTVGELDCYDQKRKAAFDKGDYQKVSHLGAELILSAICDEQGQPLPANELPSAEELINAHSNPVFVDAMKTLNAYCYGSVEEAKKN